MLAFFICVNALLRNSCLHCREAGRIGLLKVRERHSNFSGMKKLGARPKLVLPVLPKKSSNPAKPPTGEKRFRYEAAWTPHRENLRWQDMMFAGRGDLVGPDVFETSHKVVRGKHPCGTCNGLMKKEEDNIHRCQKCGDLWEVTAL
ncbi:MAG: hypothetical protein JWM68_5164 [Verrucomicrobiales bacterium]|nr:hypothetical protein [Verrucomicrobiales bacterium]